MRGNLQFDGLSNKAHVEASVTITSKTYAARVIKNWREKLTYDSNDHFQKVTALQGK